MATIFQQTSLTTVGTDSLYVWSNVVNWSNGVPTTGTAVSIGIDASTDPGGYDDLANLEVSSLSLTAGYIAVAGTLTIDTLDLSNATDAQGLASNTLIDNAAAPALLTIDAIIGSGAIIDADGADAVTVINGTDTGNTYDVAGGGMVEMNAEPNADSAFLYPGEPTDSGTFAFSDPGGTMTGSLQNVGVGDRLEVPGNTVSAVDFGPGSLTVTTDAGTTTFDDVAYQPYQVLTGQTAATDPVTGLLMVTFDGYENTDFLQTQAYGITYQGSHYNLFSWSNDNNWDNGVPVSGEGITVDATSGASPRSYDDIDDLSLVALNLVAGSVAVGRVFEGNIATTLDVASLGFGVSSASIFSDTEIGAPAATLTIDGFSGGDSGIIGAFGVQAFTEIDAAADPGEVYQVDQGGEVLLDPTPNGSPGTTGESFTFENTGTVAGTFAFQNPGGTISAPLIGVEAGDTIALPGDQVEQVTYGAGTITIVTNLGTTIFDNVAYSAVPIGWTVQPDTVSGLVDTTFGIPENAQDTQFKQTQATYEYGGTSNDFGIYLWSLLANWTSAIPTAGATVSVLAPAGAVPNSVDDINVVLSNLDDIAGGILVAATLDVGILTFGTTLPLIYADNELIGNPASLTINSITGSNYGTIGAIGFESFTGVLTPNDPGETYQVGDSAELELQPTPNDAPANSVAAFDYLVPSMSQGIASGTFAFPNPGSTVGALLANAEIGNSVALPGTFASSVTYGASTLTVVTNLGTTVFDNVTYYPGDVFSGYIQSLDPVSGLVRVTFEGSTPNGFLQTQATGIGGDGGGQFLWSTPGNWTDGVPPADSIATFDIDSSSAAVPAGYDDIASLMLNQLNIPAGYAAIGGALEIGTVAASGDFSAGLEADTAIVGGAATLTVDSFTSGSHLLIGATGTNASALVNTATDPGELYQASDGGLVDLLPTPNPASRFDLNLGDAIADTGTIAFQNPGGTVAALLADVGVGDAVELPGNSVTSVTFGADSLTVATNLGTTVFSDVTYLSGVVPGAPTPAAFVAAADPATGLESVTFALCFCEGSLIRTPSGDVPVETLAAGDTVVTARGEHRLITWIGVGRVRASPGRRTAATPVIVREGALADGVPHTDLRVTKGHSLFIDDVLIPVEFLVNHRSIQWDDQAGEGAIYHVELATHDVLIANGAPAESYRDDGNRGLFSNINSAWDQAPRPPCAPVLTGGAIVDQAWRRLLDRAGPRPELRLTEDPDLHLLVDGCRVNPTRTDGTTFHMRFRSGQRFREVRVISRAAAPCELGLTRDPRVLGVAIRSVTVLAGARSRTIGADDDRLSDGFHGYEPELDLRWTDGDAMLPADLVNCFGPAADVIVEIAGTARYEGAPHGG